MALLIRSNGETAEVFPTRKSFSLEELQHLIGGYIQVIALNGRSMIVNQEGKLHNLRENSVATQIAKGFIDADDYIVGDALIASENELGEGVTTASFMLNP